MFSNIWMPGVYLFVNMALPPIQCRNLNEHMTKIIVLHSFQKKWSVVLVFMCITYSVGRFVKNNITTTILNYPKQSAHTNSNMCLVFFSIILSQFSNIYWLHWLLDTPVAKRTNLEEIKIWSIDSNESENTLSAASRSKRYFIKNKRVQHCIDVIITSKNETVHATFVYFSIKWIY